MIQVSREVLRDAQKEAWKLEEPYYKAPESDGQRSLETSPDGNYVSEIKGGLGISAGCFPSIKGADMFYGK